MARRLRRGVIHVFCVGDRVRSASKKLYPFTGTVLATSRNLQIITVQIDNEGIYSFDVDDLEKE